MKQETKTIQGEVQNIRKDRKAIEIEEIWYQSNFNPISEDINKGDSVKIDYSIKGDFKNVVKIEKVEDLDNDSDSKNSSSKYKISDTAKNCLLMQSVQHSLNKNLSLETATNQIINSYKQIVNNISK